MSPRVTDVDDYIVDLEKENEELREALEESQSQLIPLEYMVRYFHCGVIDMLAGSETHLKAYQVAKAGGAAGTADPAHIARKLTYLREKQQLYSKVTEMFHILGQSVSNFHEDALREESFLEEARTPDEDRSDLDELLVDISKFQHFYLEIAKELHVAAQPI